jgi:hypothetical protein
VTSHVSFDPLAEDAITLLSSSTGIQFDHIDFTGPVYSRAVRCTAQCHPDNRAAIKGVRHMGFVYEGFMRKAIEGRWDALLFGMLKEECPWLPGYVPVERPDQGLRLTPSETLQ